MFKIRGYQEQKTTLPPIDQSTGDSILDDWLKQILKPIKKEDDSKGEARHYQLASKAAEKAGRDVKEFLKYYDRDLEDYLSGRRKEL